MTPEEIRKRFLFLLRAAGEHRACVLAEVVGVTTFEAGEILQWMWVDGAVEKEARGATTYWRVLSTSSDDSKPK
jgi:hypothetical protein